MGVARRSVSFFFLLLFDIKRTIRKVRHISHFHSWIPIFFHNTPLCPYFSEIHVHLHIARRSRKQERGSDLELYN